MTKLLQFTILVLSYLCWSVHAAGWFELDITLTRPSEATSDLHEYLFDASKLRLLQNTFTDYYNLFPVVYTIHLASQGIQNIHGEILTYQVIYHIKEEFTSIGSVVGNPAWISSQSKPENVAELSRIITKLDLFELDDVNDSTVTVKLLSLNDVTAQYTPVSEVWPKNVGENCKHKTPLQNQKFLSTECRSSYCHDSTLKCTTNSGEEFDVPVVTFFIYGYTKKILSPELHQQLTTHVYRFFDLASIEMKEDELQSTTRFMTKDQNSNLGYGFTLGFTAPPHFNYKSLYGKFTDDTNRKNFEAFLSSPNQGFPENSFTARVEYYPFSCYQRLHADADNPHSNEILKQVKFDKWCLPNPETTKCQNNSDCLNGFCSKNVCTVQETSNVSLASISVWALVMMAAVFFY